MSHKKCTQFTLAPVAAALLVAFGSAHAQVTPEVQELITPQSVLNVGVGGVNNASDATRFGQYNGLNKNAAALVDVEVIKRDEATGTWTTLTGRNLGLDTRELGFSQQKQGDWKYAIDYNEIVRNDPYVINTGMTGIGTATPTIKLIGTPAMPSAWATANGLAASNNIVGSDVSLKLQRKALGLSGDKWITPELQFELSFRNEDKKGSRMFGRAGLDSSDMTLRPVKGTGGANGGWAILLTPEPIDSSIRTMEGKLNFNRGDLALSGGYYASFYVNNFGSLSPNVPDTLDRGRLWNGGPAGSSTVQQLASSAVALPPDNQAHQFYLSGNYAFSPTTRANFKLAYTHATQNESFTGMGLTPSSTAPGNLGGVVNTTLAQFGLAMRPTKQLSVNASLRYEDRADKTDVSAYNYGNSTGLNGTTNWSSGSQTRTTAKVDGIYRMAGGYTASLGLDWDHKVIPVPPANTAIFANQVFFRPSLDEYGLHGSIRKSMSETLNGALSFEYKSRRGDDNGWVTTNGLAGNGLLTVDPALKNNVLPVMYMDRDRTKVRGSLDWAASEKLSIEAVAEHGQDDFRRAFNAITTQVVPTVPGARIISNDSLTLDATYKVSDDWRINGYWTLSKNRWNVNKANLGDDTRNKADTFGVSLKGKLTPRLGIGMDLLATRDVTSFNNVVATAVAGQAAGNIAGFSPSVPGNYLPDINYRTTKLKLYGSYEIDKKSGVQVTLIYQKYRTDDWQWGYNGVPYVYSDNTTVSQNTNQKLTFLGVTYIYKF
jgi:MtrB/PioB family decaheme-associated outer membrane protein